MKNEYEPQTFTLEKNDKQFYCYTPDFKVDDTFYEVKGWWDKKSIDKRRLFKEQYQNINIIYIGEKEYLKINKEYGQYIQYWENERRYKK